jgi:hypothetical protein
MSATCQTLTVGLLGLTLWQVSSWVSIQKRYSTTRTSVPPQPQQPYALWFGKVFDAPVEVCQLIPKKHPPEIP